MTTQAKLWGIYAHDIVLKIFVGFRPTTRLNKHGVGRLTEDLTTKHSFVSRRFFVLTRAKSRGKPGKNHLLAIA